MSARTLTVEELEQASGQALRSSNGASPGPDALRQFLTERLGLDEAHLSVIGASVFGRGKEARVDVHLRGHERPLRFDRFGDMAKPTELTTALMTQIGVGRMFKAADAVAIGVAVNKLADHFAEADEDEAAREWGAEYLRIAPTQQVDLSDQADRWRAFSALARINPAESAGEDRSSGALAAASVVLIDRDERRLVRSGWFQSYVKREVGGLYSPAALATQMQRVGWQRPNSEGRIKASSPSSPQTLAWRFYIISGDWEQNPGFPQVPSPTRTHTRTRGLVDTPAGTGNPQNGASSEDGSSPNGSHPGAAE